MGSGDSAFKNPCDRVNSTDRNVKGRLRLPNLCTNTPQYPNRFAVLQQLLAMYEGPLNGMKYS